MMLILWIGSPLQFEVRYLRNLKQPLLFIHRSAGNWLNICFTYTYKINNNFYKKEVSRQYIYWSIKQSPPSERMTKNIIICVTKSKESLHSLKVRKYFNDNNNNDDEKSKPVTSVYKFTFCCVVKKVSVEYFKKRKERKRMRLIRNSINI